MTKYGIYNNNIYEVINIGEDKVFINAESEGGLPFAWVEKDKILIENKLEELIDIFIVYVDPKYKTMYNPQVIKNNYTAAKRIFESKGTAMYGAILINDIDINIVVQADMHGNFLLKRIDYNVAKEIKKDVSKVISHSSQQAQKKPLTWNEASKFEEDVEYKVIFNELEFILVPHYHHQSGFYISCHYVYGGVWLLDFHPTKSDIELFNAFKFKIVGISEDKE